MGIDWDDKEKIVFATLVLPDQRILCQRPKNTGFIKVWQATAFRNLSVHSDTTTERAAEHSASATMALLFGLMSSQVGYAHLFSHYDYPIGKRLEIVICRLKSGSSITVPSSIEVRPFLLETLISEIEKNKVNFAPHTICAMSLIHKAVGGKYV